MSTPEVRHLSLAFRLVRQPDWPQDMSACLQHHIQGPLIRGRAWRLQHQQTQRPPRWNFDPRAAAARNDD